jgi:hypothetical protein
MCGREISIETSQALQFMTAENDAALACVGANALDGRSIVTRPLTTRISCKPMSTGGNRPKTDICCADLDALKLKSNPSSWEILGNSGSRLNSLQKARGDANNLSGISETCVVDHRDLLPNPI